ncbi:fibronectin type III domain-containing protein [Congregibacter sp.]|uniref:fibronectin type III domain-containing protein n=1 Tax=Congregibacter sp. TaxID=2744308 RepID=UPI003F6BD7CB
MPGVLIDIITDATPGGTNELMSPIDGSTLTVDALGNPRVDGNGTRTIGAVQLTLAPMAAVGSALTSGATVQWTRPKDPSAAKPITGYGVIVEPTDGSTPAIRIDISGPDTSSTVLTGLIPGTEYRVRVVGVNIDGDGPPSNTVVFATSSQPSAAPPTPVPVMPITLLFLTSCLLLLAALRKIALSSTGRV